MTKRFLFLFLTVLSLFGTASCQKDNRDYYAMPEPNIARYGDCSVEYRDILGFMMETDYSAIEPIIEKTVYPVDFDEFNIEVINRHPGKAFHIFTVPFLKHETEAGTIILPFSTEIQLEAYGEEGLWGICGFTHTDTACYQTRIKVIRSDYVYDFVPGNYTVCIYLANRVIEIPITLE